MRKAGSKGRSIAMDDSSENETRKKAISTLSSTLRSSGASDERILQVVSDVLAEKTASTFNRYINISIHPATGAQDWIRGTLNTVSVVFDGDLFLRDVTGEALQRLRDTYYPARGPG